MNEYSSTRVTLPCESKAEILLPVGKIKLVTSAVLVQ